MDYRGRNNRKLAQRHNDTLKYELSNLYEATHPSSLPNTDPQSRLREILSGFDSSDASSTYQK